MATRTKDKNKEKRMSIWGHLAELRRRLTVIVVVVLTGSVVFYFLSPQVFHILMMQIIEHFPNPDNLPYDELIPQVTQILGLLDPFTFRFFIGFVTSIIVTSPIWLWQLLAFFLPALKPKERKWFVPTFALGITLFLGGAVFCYFFILDPAVTFLFSQADDISQITLVAPALFDILLLFLIAFGVAFELPLVIFYLTVFNIVPYKKLRKSWRVVYIVLLVLSAFITPDASPVTMVLMFCALTVLYEASLLVSRIVSARRNKAREAEEAAEALA